MRIRQLLHSCIVLAVGVGLVSCSKEEINQVMNRPAEIIQSSSPCVPAGVVSTTTPELCVNLTEIRLLSRDTEADVSLTLVNRTDRRLFLQLKGSPYMTDGSGAKWEMVQSTGINAIAHGAPVPLEPNGEAQVSFLFRRSGQAPSGLMFSMRGEIAIMKVDASRGEPIPHRIAVSRGVNLSGIRPPPQPTPSGSSTEQNLDTKVAQVSPRGDVPDSGQLSQSPNLCPPGGMATTTPELCVNLTEIRLLSRDTEADVSLTLVNRTGRRLFLQLKGTPYMTDSSGAKWEMVQSTGINAIAHGAPVPLEPNGEAQIAFLFRRSGQAPSDLTFSMHGEIAIMKVDASRGEPIPHRIAVSRGVNLSGIRLPPQPSRSDSPTHQNQGTEFSQLSASDAEPAAPGTQSPPDATPSSTTSESTDSDASVVSESMAIDVVGLRLGMSPVEVEKVFKQRHLDNGILPSRPTNESIGVGKTLKVFTIRDIATGQDIKIKDSEYVATMRGVYDAGPIPGAQREEIRAQFTPLHNKEQLVIIWREQSYSPGNQPATDTLMKSLQDKYGSHMAKSGCDIHGTDCQYIWHFRQDGKPIRNVSNECIEYGKRVGGYIYSVPDMESQSNKCGSILVRAKMSGRNGLVNSVVIGAHNVELDLSTHKAANAIMEAAQKEKTDRQMEKARTQKPDF